MIFKNLDQSFCQKIAKLFSDNFFDGWTMDMLKSAFSNRRFYCFGALDGLRLVGAVTFSYAVDTADIEDIVVDKEFLRQKVGERLINMALEQIKEDKIFKVLLEVRKSNLPAINLYKKNGFIIINERKKYYSDGEDALLMAKEL